MDRRARGSRSAPGPGPRGAGRAAATPAAPARGATPFFMSVRGTGHHLSSPARSGHVGVDTRSARNRVSAAFRLARTRRAGRPSSGAGLPSIVPAPTGRGGARATPCRDRVAFKPCLLRSAASPSRTRPSTGSTGSPARPVAQLQVAPDAHHVDALFAHALLEDLRRGRGRRQDLAGPDKRGVRRFWRHASIHLCEVSQKAVRRNSSSFPAGHLAGGERWPPWTLAAYEEVVHM